MIVDPKPYQSTHFLYIYIPLRIHRWICPDIEEYFRVFLVEVRNYAKSESMELDAVVSMEFRGTFPLNSI